jgi:hypothetical protein
MRLQKTEKITMRYSCISIIVALVLFFNCERVFSQATNTFPTTGFAGIGTTSPVDALTLNYVGGNSDTAFIRLTNNSTSVYGIIGLMPSSYPYYSSLSTGEDLIIHEHSQGDLILTNYQSTSTSHPYGAIRFATTPGASDLPLTSPPLHDVERMVINPNGNIGINLPPNISTGLDSARDQVQIGGGSAAPIGYTAPIPGLTIYGGNRFEGMLEPSGAPLTNFPVDYRGIYFNHYENHTTGITQRFEPMGSSGIAFADVSGGTLLMTCWPPETAAPLADSIGSMSLSLTGNQGLQLWSDERLNGGSEYNHLFDAYRPGYLPTGVTRNVHGLFFHHTPVYISDSADFVNIDSLPFVHPRLGDGLTWMLAVNGSALAKEFYVSTDWPDFVFDPSYKLAPLDDVEKYIEGNHHLPGIPSAKEMDTTGVPLGKTEAALTQKVEELTLYVIDQNKKIEQLESDIQELKDQKEK